MKWLKPRRLIVLLALVLFGLPWEFCMNGTGYGFPFAWFHPGHGEWGEFPLHGDIDHGAVIDLPNLLASLFLLAAGAWAVMFAEKKLRSQSQGA